MRYAKNTLIFFFCFIITIGNTYADKFKSADFLASKWILVNHSWQPANYNIEKKISRKEFVSIIINLSGGTNKTECEYNFRDVINDWGCKYIDEAFERGYIVKNNNFNPEKNITQGEALGLIFKAKAIEVIPTTVWQKAYFDEAIKREFLTDKNYLYDISAKRGWIFDIAASTYPAYVTFSQESFIAQSDQWSRILANWSTRSTSTENRKSNIVKNTESWVLEWEYIEYYDNGAVKLKNFYNGGVLFWESIWYYYDWWINFKGTYKGGRLEGPYVKYHTNGNLAFEEFYSKGLLNGVCTYYTESGWIRRKREYIWGFLLREF